MAEKPAKSLEKGRRPLNRAFEEWFRSWKMRLSRVSAAEEQQKAAKQPPLRRPWLM
jgi:hypothetical protein